MKAKLVQCKVIVKVTKSLGGQVLFLLLSKRNNGHLFVYTGDWKGTEKAFGVDLLEKARYK